MPAGTSTASKSTQRTTTYAHKTPAAASSSTIRAASQTSERHETQLQREPYQKLHKILRLGLYDPTGTCTDKRSMVRWSSSFRRTPAAPPCALHGLRWCSRLKVQRERLPSAVPSPGKDFLATCQSRRKFLPMPVVLCGGFIRLTTRVCSFDEGAEHQDTGAVMPVGQGHESTNWTGLAVRSMRLRTFIGCRPEYDIESELICAT